MRRNAIFLVSSVVIIVGLFIATLVSGSTPVLGLDLRGGVSVVFSPVGKYSPDALDVALDIIRSRVDSFGTTEPEISRQGTDIVVDLPGVKDRCGREDADDHDDHRRARVDDEHDDHHRATHDDYRATHHDDHRSGAGQQDRGRVRGEPEPEQRGDVEGHRRQRRDRVV